MNDIKPPTAPQLYRKTTIGTTLDASLDDWLPLFPEIMREGVREKILTIFDNVVANHFKSKGKPQLTLKCGKLDCYRCVDQVWTLILKDAEVRENYNELFRVPRLKIMGYAAAENSIVQTKKKANKNDEEKDD